MMQTVMEPLVDGNKAINIESTWDRYFEVVPALTPALLDQVYALRYQVYCVEHSFEDPAKHPTGRETDCHDPFSQHVAVVYRPSGEVVGTGRLISRSGGAVPYLPLLSLLGQDAQAELRHYPLDHMAEISRYVVSKSFRRRKGEAEFPDVGYSPLDAETSRRLMPHLTLGLIRGLLQLGVSRHVLYFSACMRPALLRLLRQLGLEFKPIGPLVNYHGLRQPCVASVHDLLMGLKAYGAGLCGVPPRPSDPKCMGDAGMLQ
jgi:N-acyl amino acid synthase of PEP-CTERM/exosortase system